MTARTIVTIGIAITKVASGHHTQSPRAVVARIAAASTGSHRANSLSKESLAIDHMVRVDSTLARVQDGAAEGGQHSEAAERARWIGVRGEGGGRVVSFYLFLFLFLFLLLVVVVVVIIGRWRGGSSNCASRASRAATTRTRSSKTTTKARRRAEGSSSNGTHRGARGAVGCHVSGGGGSGGNGVGVNGKREKAGFNVVVIFDALSHILFYITLHLPTIFLRLFTLSRLTGS